MYKMIKKLPPMELKRNIEKLEYIKENNNYFKLKEEEEIIKHFVDTDEKCQTCKFFKASGGCTEPHNNKIKFKELENYYYLWPTYFCKIFTSELKEIKEKKEILKAKLSNIAEISKIEINKLVEDN